MSTLRDVLHRGFPVTTRLQRDLPGFEALELRLRGTR